jgi:hypothetical protein
MIEPSSLEKKLEVVFDELVEDLSVVTSGILFIHIRDNRVASFGVRQRTEAEKGDQIIQPDRIGLSPVHQNSFRSMAIEVFKRKQVWLDGEMLFPFTVHARTLRASAQYKPFRKFQSK